MSDVVQLNEWQRLGPSSSGEGAVLRDRVLGAADRAAVASHAFGKALHVRELREGLELESTSYVGSVSLAGLRVEIRPKIGIRNVMRMVARAFGLGELRLLDSVASQGLAPLGFADVMGLALLREVQRLVRRGLLSAYVLVEEKSSTPRGRIELRHRACSPPAPRVRCRYEDFTPNHAVHQVVRSGLLAAAAAVAERRLSCDLRRAGERFFPDVSKVELSRQSLRNGQRVLDRRSKHYEVAYKLIELFHQGRFVEDAQGEDRVAVPGFLLNMNLLFERFLERELARTAPTGGGIRAQQSRSHAYTWHLNPRSWRTPRIQPDLEILEQGSVRMIADAKYRSHDTDPPSTAELYQLTTYGLAYEGPEPLPTLLLYPTMQEHAPARPPRLSFQPHGGAPVKILLVGVPVNRMLVDPSFDAWSALVAPFLPGQPATVGGGRGKVI